jgi:alpha-amylase
VIARDGAATIDGVASPLSVETEVSVGGGRLDPSLRWTTTVRNTGDRAVEARFGSEWALTMLGGGGNPQAWWDVGGERAGHDGAGAAADIASLGQGNSWLGLEIETSVSPAADAWHAPIETVSNSEAGFERVYQGSALLLSWPVRLEPGESWSATIEHRATVEADRAEVAAGELLSNRA